jgi:hypothetical protein
MAGPETLPASGHSTTRNPEVDERSARQKRVRSVASAHEAKIHLRQYTLSDSRFRLRNLEWEYRRSTGRAFDCFEVTELWMEYSSQSEDRWQNGRQRCAGTALRSLCAGGPSRIDRLGDTKLILF